MLNFSPDHLDRHPSVEAYAAAKARIFENQGTGDWAVINADDPSVLGLARAGLAQKRLFARHEPLTDGTIVEGGWIVGRSDGRRSRSCRLGRFDLLGPHLVDDVMAAATASAIAGATSEAMTAAVDSFGGLEHAMELVASIGACGSSTIPKATNVEAGAALGRKLRCRTRGDRRRPVQGR